MNDKPREQLGCCTSGELALSLSPTMLSIIGFSMVATFMTLIMTKRLSALIALIVVPIAFGLCAGFAGGLGPMMLQGISAIAPTAVMLMFAILYFGLMIEVGLFDSTVRALLRIVHGDPLKIVIGTVVLATVVSLDGDGSTTYMVTTAALLPLYRKMGINPLIMACLIMLSSGVMNLTPWGGPTARAASALHLDPAEVFIAVIPGMMAGIAFLLVLAWRFGMVERRRVGYSAARIADDAASMYPLASADSPRRPRLLWFNVALTSLLLVLLVRGTFPLPVLFMCAFCAAMIVNYPRLENQKERIAALAPNVLAVVSLIFAAGIFTGILSGTGMIDAMSQGLLAAIPESLGPYMAPITALVSLPMTFFVSNDAFYFGMLPLLAESGAHYGIAPISIACASLTGQPLHLLSPLVPSTYLLVNLSGLEFSEHQRFTLKWAIATCLVVILGSMAAGAFPLVAKI
jgi:CitMHS family citrate-Mg2+:H+ or citrate-Ca2+:H+ symporter